MTDTAQCARCEGDGRVPHAGRVIVCPYCDGSGVDDNPPDWYEDDGLRADGGTKYGDKLPEGGTADLYADDEGNGAAWRDETSAVSIEIDVQLHEEGYQTDRKWTVHCSDRGDDSLIAGYGVEHQNKGNFWRRGDRWDDAIDFADLPFPVRRRVAAVLDRPLDEITPEHRRIHREDGTGLADEAGDRDD